MIKIIDKFKETYMMISISKQTKQRQEEIS